MSLIQRTKSNEASQLAIETTANTAPAGGYKTLDSLTLTNSLDQGSEQFTPDGKKVPSRSSIMKRSGKVAITGKQDYNHMTWLFASVFGNHASTTNPGGSTTHTFSFNSGAVDAAPTYTVQQGSTAGADQVVGAEVDALTLSLARSASAATADVSGSMIGTNYTAGITKSVDATAVPAAELLPQHVAGYLDSTQAGLGTTRLNKLLTAEFAIPSRRDLEWYLNNSNTGAQNTAEKQFKPTIKIKISDAEDAALVRHYIDSGERCYLRLESVGPEIAADETFLLNLDVCGQFDTQSPKSFEGELVSLEVQFAVVSDNTGFSNAVTLVNTVAAL